MAMIHVTIKHLQDWYDDRHPEMIKPDFRSIMKVGGTYHVDIWWDSSNLDATQIVLCLEVEKGHLEPGQPYEPMARCLFEDGVIRIVEARVLQERIIDEPLP